MRLSAGACPWVSPRVRLRWFCAIRFFLGRRGAFVGQCPKCGPGRESVDSVPRAMSQSEDPSASLARSLRLGQRLSRRGAAPEAAHGARGPAPSHHARCCRRGGGGSWSAAHTVQLRDASRVHSRCLPHLLRLQWRHSEALLSCSSEGALVVSAVALAWGPSPYPADWFRKGRGRWPGVGALARRPRLRLLDSARTRPRPQTTARFDERPDLAAELARDFGVSDIGECARARRHRPLLSGISVAARGVGGMRVSLR